MSVEACVESVLRRTAKWRGVFVTHAGSCAPSDRWSRYGRQLACLSGAGMESSADAILLELGPARVGKVAVIARACKQRGLAGRRSDARRQALLRAAGRNDAKRSRRGPTPWLPGRAGRGESCSESSRMPVTHGSCACRRHGVVFGRRDGGRCSGRVLVHGGREGLTCSHARANAATGLGFPVGTADSSEPHTLPQTRCLQTSLVPTNVCSWRKLCVRIILQRCPPRYSASMIRRLSPSPFTRHCSADSAGPP
jgi:hypothetical protein